MCLDVALLTLCNKASENMEQAVLSKEVLDQLPNACNHKIAHKMPHLAEYKTNGSIVGTHICNPSTQEVGPGGLSVPESLN